jgi:hypothetical protein
LLNKTSAYLNESPDNLISLKGTPQHATAAMLAFAVHAAYSYEKLLEKDQAHLQARAPGGSLRGLRHRLATLFTPNRIAEQRAELGNGPNVPAMGPQVLAASMYLSWVGSMSSLAQPVSTREGVNFLNFHRGGYTDPFYTMIANSEATNKKQRALKELLLATAFSAFLDPKSANSRIVFAGTFNPMAYYTSLGSRDPFVHITQQIEKAKSLAQNPEADIRELYAIEKSVSQEIDSAQKYIKQKQAESGDLDSRVVSRGIGGVISSETVQVNNAYEKAGLGEQIVVIPQYRFGGDHKIRGIEGVQLVKFMRPETLRAAGAFEDYSDPVLSLQVKLMRLLRFGGSIHSKAVNKIALTTQEKQIYESILQVAGALRLAQEQMVASGLQRYMGGRFMLAGRNVIAGTAAEIDPGTMVLGSQVWEDIATQTVDTFYKKINAAASKQKGVQAADTEQVDFNQLRLNQVKALKDKLVQQVRQDRGDVLGDAYAAKAAVALQTLEIAIAGGEGEGSLSALTLKQEQLQSEVRTLIEQSGFGAVKSVAEFRRTAGFEIRRLLKSHFQQAAEGMAEAAQNRRGAAALKNSLTAVQDLLDAEQQNKLTELDARISGAYDRFYKEAPSKQDYVERDQAYEQRITELRDRNADLKDEVKALNRKMPAQVRGELIKIAGSGADVKDYLITELRKHQKGNALYVHHSLTEQGIASLPESLKLVQQRDALQTEINQNIASMGQERSQRNAELRQVVQAGVKDSEQSDQEIQGLFKEKNRVVNSLFHEVVGKLTTQINEATLAGNTEHANALLARITSNAHMHYAYLQQQIGNQVAAFFKGNRLVSREDGSIDLEHLQANLTGDSAEGRRVLQLAGQLNQLKQNLDEQAIGKKQIKQAQRQINYRDAFEQALRTLALDPLARRSIGLFGMMQRSGAPQGNHALVTGELLTDTEFNEGDRRILLDAGFNRTGVLFNIGAMGVFLGDNDGDAALIAALQRNVELRLNSLGLDGENLTKEEQNELEGVRRQRLITQQEIHFMMTKEYTAFGHLFDEAKLYGMGSRDAIASASLVDGSYTEASQQKAAWAYRELHAQVVATVGHTELDPLTELAGLDAQTREQRAGELVGRLYAGKGDALTFNGIALSEEQAKTAWLGYAGRLSDAYTLGMSASKFTRDQVGMHQELIGFMNKKRDSYATYGDAFDAFFAEGGAGETLGRKMYAKNEGMLTDIFMGGQSEGDAYAPVSLKAFQTLMSMTLFAATSVMSSVYEAVDIARVVADTNRTASIADIASGESFAELKSSYLELQAGQGDQLAYERANAIHNRQLGALLTLQQIARDAIKPKKSGIELINEIEKRLKNSPFVKGSDMAMDAELNPHMQGLENVVRIALDKDFRGNSLNASDVPDLSNETQRNAFVEQLITTLDFHHGENAAIAESLLNASAGSKDDRHRQQAELVADLFQKVATIGQQKRAVGLALSRMDTSSPDAMAETFAKMYEGSAFRLTSNAQKAEILTRELFSLQSRAKLNDHGRFEGLLRQIFSYDLYFGGVKADVATTKANFQKMALLQTGNIEFAERFGEIYEGYRQTNEQTSDAPGANRNFYEEYFQKAFVGDFFADFQTNYKQKFGTVLEDTVQSILDFTPDGSSEAGKSIKKLQDRLQKGLADIQSRPDGRVSEVAVASLISRIDQEGNRDEKAAYLGIDEIGSELGLSEDKIASFKAAQNMALAQSLINNTRASDLFQQGYGLVDESQAHGQPSATAQKLIHTGTNVLGFAAISTAAALMTQTSGAEAAEDEQSSGALIGQSVATAAAMAHPASLASVLTGNPNSSAGQKLESLGLMGVGVAAGAFAGNMVNEHYHNKLIQTITEGSIESEEHLLQQVGRNSQKANIYGSAVSAIVGGAAPLLLEAMAQAIGLKKEFNPIPQAMMDLVGIDLESLGDVMDDFIEESFNLNPDTGSVDSQGRIAVFDAAGNFVDQVSYVHNWASVDSEVESGDPTSQIAEDALESVITSYHYDSNLHPL